MFDYGDRLAHGFGEIAPYGLILVLLGVATVVALWRWPKVGLLGLWFFAILAPTSSLLPACVTQTVAEHRMYLPSAAVLIGVVLVVYALGCRLVRGGALSLRASRIAGVSLTACVAVAFGVLTLHRNWDYADAATLWADTAAKMPTNDRAGQFGLDMLGKRPILPGGGPFPAVLKIKPADEKHLTGLGNAWMHLGRMEEAAVQYRKALAV